MALPQGCQPQGVQQLVRLIQLQPGLQLQPQQASRLQAIINSVFGATIAMETFQHASAYKTTAKAAGNGNTYVPNLLTLDGRVFHGAKPLNHAISHFRADIALRKLRPRIALVHGAAIQQAIGAIDTQLPALNRLLVGRSLCCLHFLAGLLDGVARQWQWCGGGGKRRCSCGSDASGLRTQHAAPAGQQRAELAPWSAAHAGAPGAVHSAVQRVEEQAGAPEGAGAGAGEGGPGAGLGGGRVQRCSRPSARRCSRGCQGPGCGRSCRRQRAQARWQIPQVMWAVQQGA